MTTAKGGTREPQPDEIPAPLRGEDCRTMARMCEWKADVMPDPGARDQWLSLARRWRDLAEQIDGS
jgi:hypothetical protein